MYINGYNFIFQIHEELLCINTVTSFYDLIHLHNDEQKRYFKIWNLKDLLDKSVKLENVRNRVLEPLNEKLEEMQFSSVVGSNIYVTEDDQITQYSFWP